MNYKAEIIKVLKDLSKIYPNQLLSSHITLALEEYSKDFWISDKEFYYALEKYRCEKELDNTNNIISSKELEELYNESSDLTLEDLLDIEDEEY